jgi:uncharacterized membrane protein YqhA
MIDEKERGSSLSSVIENGFESTLWYSRLILILGVVSCIFTAMALVLLGLSEVFKLLSWILNYVSESLVTVTRDKIILHVIKVLDTFLLAAILFIFSFGLYELFISPIEKSNDKKFASKAFEITTIDQLKAKLGKVIIMLLVIKVFAYLVEIKPTNIIETLYIGVIVLCMALSLWIGHKK